MKIYVNKHKRSKINIYIIQKKKENTYSICSVKGCSVYKNEIQRKHMLTKSRKDYNLRYIQYTFAQ